MSAHVEIEHRPAQVPGDLLYDPALTDGAVRLYGALYLHGSDPSNCYPSYARLGDLIGKSPRSIPKLVNELAAAGWIEVVRRVNSTGQQSNGYRLHAAPKRSARRAA